MEIADSNAGEMMRRGRGQMMIKRLSRDFKKQRTAFHGVAIGREVILYTIINNRTPPISLSRLAVSLV